jgi:hypothetical protein
MGLIALTSPDYEIWGSGVRISSGAPKSIDRTDLASLNGTAGIRHRFMSEECPNRCSPEKLAAGWAFLGV